MSKAFPPPSGHHAFPPPTRRSPFPPPAFQNALPPPTAANALQAAPPQPVEYAPVVPLHAAAAPGRRWLRVPFLVWIAVAVLGGAAVGAAAEHALDDRNVDDNTTVAGAGDGPPIVIATKSVQDHPASNPPVSTAVSTNPRTAHSIVPTTSSPTSASAPVTSGPVVVSSTRPPVPSSAAPASGPVAAPTATPALVVPTSQTPAATVPPTPAATAPPTPAPTEPAPTAAPPGCDPNYTPCVPIDSDVDCAGAGEDGPSYVVGPVIVIGIDIYQLDDDGDGVGCD